MAKKNELPHSAAYRPALSAWRKAWGSKPTEASFSLMHAFNLRQGSKHALAMAMYHRDEGATDQQVMAAAHTLTPENGHQGVLHNYRRRYCGADGAPAYFTRDMAVPKGVYKITLTEKGKAFVDRKAAAAAATTEPVKPKATKKPKAKKPVTVTEPVTEPVAVPVTVDTPAAEQVAQ